MNENDFYKILGVDKNADKEEIKKAYRKLAHQFHPDKNRDDQAASDYIKIREAFECLVNEEKRKNYDQESGEEVKVNFHRRPTRKPTSEAFHKETLNESFFEEEAFIERIFNEFFGRTSPRTANKKGGDHIHYDDMIR